MQQEDKNLNPLDSFPSSTVYHILIAFEKSEDAYTSRINGLSVPANGIVFNASSIGGTGNGKAIVVVNELYDKSTNIVHAESSWSFFAPHDSKTTSYVGTITTRDQSGFLFTQTLKELTQDLGISLHHLTFAWVPLFLCQTQQDDNVRIFVNPLYFHITSLSQSVDNVMGRTYQLDFVSCYNTYGNGPQFSELYQNTITHNASNNANIVPKNGSFSLGINLVKDEDEEKLKKRQDRLNSVKYMTTVGDFAASLEYSMNNQKTSHKTQLQEFLGLIKDSHSRKIKPLKQEDALPIEYKINCCPYYINKKLDNRNLPYEQTEIDQNIAGISSMTFPLGYSIHQVLSRVMTMSKDIGADHQSNDKVMTYKFTTTTNRNTEGKYIINTKINNYISPFNSNQRNTGPGTNLIKGKTIELTYQNTTDNSDIMSISYSSGPQFSLNNLEEVDDAPDTQSIYGDREPPTSNRNRGTLKYFNNSFSGVPVSRSINNNIGLQNSQTASAISNFKEQQQVLYTIEIKGNPHLLSDINRNPLDVMQPQVVTDSKSSNTIGRYNIYSNVEYSPMYIKVRILLDSSIGGKSLTATQRKTIQPSFYYSDYLHITRIDNIFSGGGFIQYIYCSRTDENA